MRRIRNNKEIFFKAAALLFWVCIWQIMSMVVNKEMLLASPFAVLGTLIVLLQEQIFWTSISYSFIKIAAGFILAMTTGIILAILSYCSAIVRELIMPLMKVIRAAPVASFIILALIWVSADNLSILISFLMVLPMMYFNILQGIYNTDKKLLEMAHVFHVKAYKKFLYIYLPSVTPYFISACSSGLGFCWKAGIAAEVIGLPSHSIGLRLYESKLYFMTKELFAWTIVIIVVSIIFENLFMWIIRFIKKLIEKY